jgi:hypothetical protein
MEKKGKILLKVPIPFQIRKIAKNPTRATDIELFCYGNVVNVVNMGFYDSSVEKSPLYFGKLIPETVSLEAVTADYEFDFSDVDSIVNYPAAG